MALSFGEFLASRQQLMEATKKDPVVTIDYTVSKYCKMPTGSSKEDKTYVAVKPNDVIHITWLCESIENPTPVCVKINDTEYKLFYAHQKVKSWLYTNTMPKDPKCDLLV